MKEIDKMRGDLDQLKNVESTMIKTMSRDQIITVKDQSVSQV